MFITRPLLPPLGLDLADLEGGGSCPSQFFGRTTDDRPVYIRYRHGWLTVYRGAVGQSQDALPDEMDVLLQEHIGPAFHGIILPEQVCDLTGITIRGRRPDLPEEKRKRAAEHDDILDWSGRTTYWERQFDSTVHGVENYVGMLASRFPDLKLLGTAWASGQRRYVSLNSIAECQDGATLAFGGSAASLKAILGSDHVRLQDLAAAFAHTAYLRLFDFTRIRNRPRERPRSEGGPTRDPAVERWKRPLDEQLSEEVGRPLAFAECVRGIVRTGFATDSAEGQSFIRDFIAVADACFANEVELVDLRTGEVIRRSDTAVMWHSIDLVEWCRAAPDRYIEGGWDPDDSGKPIAWRPAPS